MAMITNVNVSGICCTTVLAARRTGKEDRQQITLTRSLSKDNTDTRIGLSPEVR